MLNTDNNETKRQASSRHLLPWSNGNERSVPVNAKFDQPRKLGMELCVSDTCKGFISRPAHVGPYEPETAPCRSEQMLNPRLCPPKQKPRYKCQAPHPSLRSFRIPRISSPRIPHTLPRRNENRDCKEDQSACFAASGKTGHVMTKTRYG